MATEPDRQPRQSNGAAETTFEADQELIEATRRLRKAIEDGTALPTQFRPDPTTGSMRAVIGK